ncbi:MAG: flagellar basal body rod protein FlgB [Lachnospiraceae bacterium]|nr:flagellar basal body rod protein FlgB [Lachnospiraceae bacterium]
MLNSNAFSYVDVLGKAADASWMRESALANNIANVDTPGYKRQDVEFQNVLESELKSTKYKGLNDAVNNVKLDRLDPDIYTDYGSFSYRLDGNNVDVDTENVEIASEQLRYQTLTSAVSREFDRFKSVIK